MPYTFPILYRYQAQVPQAKHRLHVNMQKVMFTFSHFFFSPHNLQISLQAIVTTHVMDRTHRFASYKAESLVDGVDGSERHEKYSFYSTTVYVTST